MWHNSYSIKYKIINLGKKMIKKNPIQPRCFYQHVAWIKKVEPNWVSLLDLKPVSSGMNNLVENKTKKMSKPI